MITPSTRIYFAHSIAWCDALPILSFILGSVSSIPLKVSLAIVASVFPLSVPTTDFQPELILTSSLDSRSIVFGRPHYCTLTLGLLYSIWEMTSFVSLVSSPSKWSWNSELWSKLLPWIGEGLEINGIEFSVSSIETKCGRAAERACSRLACAMHQICR